MRLHFDDPFSEPRATTRRNQAPLSLPSTTHAMPSVASPAESPESHPDITPEAVADRHERFFCTEAVTRDLKRRTVRGGAITISSQAAKFLLRLGSTAVLARLLTPADFGLIAMVTVITGFVEMFKDAGLSMATIQRERITHAQVSTLFWINVALSFLIMLVIAAMAPAIAWFYGEPRLLWITIALAGTMIFGGLAVQHQALLRRQMLFGRLAAVEICSMAAGVITAIVLARQGYTYWSLVAMTAATAASTALLSFLLSGWVPGLPVKKSGVRELLKFGGNLTGFSFINYFARNGDNFLIGWWWGPGPLALYSKAYGLLLLPIHQINGPVSNVVTPALSRLQNRPDEYRRYYYRAIEAIACLGMPLVCYSAVMADELVLVLLGDQWNGSVPLFRALLPFALVGTLNVAPGWVYVSLGRASRQLRWAMVSTPVYVAGMLIGLPFGPFGVAIACSCTFSVLWVFGMRYCFESTCLCFRDFLHAIWPPAFAAAAAALVSAILKFGILGLGHGLYSVCLHAVVYAIVYVVVLLVASAHMRSLVRARARKLWS